MDDDARLQEMRCVIQRTVTAAVTAMVLVSCSSGASTPAESAADGTLDIAPTIAPTVVSIDVIPTDVTAEAPAADVSPTTDVAGVDASTSDPPVRLGEVIGAGSSGPAVDAPQPWPLNTVYTDLEPQALVIDFAPPNPQCVAAQADATIGRGGAILVSLWVDANRTDGSCEGSARSNQIRIPLSEPLGDRRIYTSTVPDTGGASEAAELLADSIIGLDAVSAIAAIEAAGFQARDLTDLDMVDSDFSLNRINITTSNGVVDFAAVY